MIVQILGILLLLLKAVTEFLFLAYVSLCEKLVRKLLDEGVLDSAIFSIEAVEGRTFLALVFLPLCNFICDLVVCIAMDVSILIPYMLLLEMFMPMISYYVGEILSKGIRSEHVRSIEYREVPIGRGPFMVRRIPIIMLNEN